PPAQRHPPRIPPVSSGQGPPSRVQGQAGLRYLPCACEERWSQEAGRQRRNLRQAYQPGCEPAQISEVAAQYCRGARRAPLRQLARTQQLLDQPGQHVQVLRGHPRRPHAQGHPPRRPHQLDRQPCAQAPRD
ncbi:hypothetical protein LTR75_018319, partial [Friedmanniomyces endolithicus]